MEEKRSDAIDFVMSNNSPALTTCQITSALPAHRNYYQRSYYIFKRFENCFSAFSAIDSFMTCHYIQIPFADGFLKRPSIYYISLETKSCRILPLIYVTKYDRT